MAGVLIAALLVTAAFVRSEWYLAENGGTVAIYRGIKGDILGIPLSELVGMSAVKVSDLPSSVQDQLEQGIRVNGEEAALATIDSYHRQIDEEAVKAAQVAEGAKSDGQPGVEENGAAEDAEQSDQDAAEASPTEGQAGDAQTNGGE